ncbi:MAG TPA: polysaccharide biosynthesis/export family protein [Candidatus Polarisedimenticolia bacterium]|nr:polysaccharide biosynthesis/export family protein [Candidatus Polarisedimenticolia bacterium]
MTGKLSAALALAAATAAATTYQKPAAPAERRPAAAAAKTAPAPAREEVKVSPGDYQIGPEDVLDIAVWNNTAISRTVPVRPDGKISLPLLNDLQAGGRTPLQLRDELIRKLAEFMSNPEVSVIVREVHSLKVSVIGEVKKTGRFELRSRATVLDVLAQAEGVNEFASRSRIVVLRTDGSGTKRIPFNYNEVMKGGSQENFTLQPGDIIVVP